MKVIEIKLTKGQIKKIEPLIKACQEMKDSDNRPMVIGNLLSYPTHNEVTTAFALLPQSVGLELQESLKGKTLEF